MSLISYTDTILATSDIAKAWTRSAGADNYALIDDPVATPDDDTTYVETAGDVTDLYGIVSPTLPLRSIINSVTVYARAKRVTYGASGNEFLLLRVNGVTYESSLYSLGGTTYTDFNKSWATNPGTTAAWSVEDINGTGTKPLQGFGIKNNNAVGDTHRFTQVYLVIAYQMPKGGVILCY